MIYLLAQTFTVECSFAAHRLDKWLLQKEGFQLWRAMLEAQECYL
ncbi:hypothetical protein [Pseudobacillus badius]|nr:hypothetical protein [Bacillus badius]